MASTALHAWLLASASLVLGGASAGFVDLLLACRLAPVVAGRALVTGVRLEDERRLVRVVDVDAQVILAVIVLLQRHLIPLGAASREAPSSALAGLYGPVLLLVFLGALVLILRGVLLRSLAVVPPPLEQGLVGLLGLLALHVLELFCLGRRVADGVVALL